MGKWLSYGAKTGTQHDVPPIVRFLGLGPSEGARWECRCGKVHELIAIPGIHGKTAYRWDLSDAAESADANAEPPCCDEVGVPYVGINLQGLPVVVEKYKPRLIPHSPRETALNLADKIDPKRTATAEGVEHALAVLRQLADWGYIAFPEPVAGKQA